MRKKMLALLMGVVMVSMVPSVSLAVEVGGGDDGYGCTWQWVNYYEWINGQRIWVGQEYKCV